MFGTIPAGKKEIPQPPLWERVIEVMGEACKRSNGAELVDWYPDGYLKKAQGAKVDDAMRLKYASENLCLCTPWKCLEHTD